MDDKEKIAKIVAILDDPYLYDDASDRLSDIRAVAEGRPTTVQVLLNPHDPVTQWVWGEG